MQEKNPTGHPSISRRRFFQVAMGTSAGLALYAGEIERHWIEITRRDIHIQGLPASFNGFRVAQMSDIHLDEFTEPFFLRHAVERINSLRPDIVLLTGDFISNGISTTKSPSEPDGSAQISSLKSNASRSLPFWGTTISSWTPTQ